MSQFFLLFFFICLVSQNSMAESFSSDTTLGRYTFSEVVTVEKSLGKSMLLPKSYLSGDVESDSWNYSLGFSSVRSTSTTGETTVSRTFIFGLGISLQKSENSVLDFGFNFTSTPIENLTTLGVTGAYSYFTSPYSFGTVFGLTSYSQSSVTNKVRRNQGGIATNSISQFLIGVNASDKLNDWMKVKFSFSHYAYSKSVSNFLSYLDNVSNENARVDGLINSVMSFPKDAFGLKFQFYPSDGVDLNLGIKRSYSEYDNSETNSSFLGGSRDFNKDTNLELELESSQTRYQNNSSQSNSDTSTLITIGLVLNY